MTESGADAETATWGDLFERAAAFDASEPEIRERLERRREREHDDGGDTGTDAEPGGRPSGAGGSDGPPEPPEPNPARVAVDADVLAADLLVGGDARRALDSLREHSWTTLVAGDPLLDDAEAVIRDLAAADLAADWRERVEAWREPVAHPAGDHPALAAAYRGGAMHLLTLDPRLQTAQAGASLRKRVELSVRHPKAFATLFDAASLYPEAVGGTGEGGEEEGDEGGDYPGPDRDPRV